MRPTVPAFAILSLLLLSATPATAQTTKTMKGSVSAVGADSVTVKAGSEDMKFGVDNTTSVVAPGGGTKARAAAARGGSGVKVADVIKVGQPVEVSYRDLGGNLHATKIQAISSAGGSVPSRADGTVAAITATSLTLNGTTAGGGTFTQTYAIDSKTKVVGSGAGTATAAAGGRIVVTDLIKTGDKVQVAFSGEGSAIRATEIHVSAKAPK